MPPPSRRAASRRPVSSRGIALCFALLAGLAASAECARYPVEPWTPEYLSLWIDADRSSEMGADDLIAAHYATGRLEDALLKPQYWREERFWAKVGGFGYRLGRLLWFDEPTAFYASVLQHEYFGHGFRGREFGYPRIRYEFGAPPPLGRGGGTTFYTFPEGPGYSYDRIVTESMAGVEAEGVEADRLRLAWMQAGTVDAHGAWLYLSLRNSLRDYLSVSHESALRDPDADLSNDMLSYVMWLNNKEDGRFLDEWPMHLNHIKSQAAWDLVDPFFWYSIWGVAAEHLWKAKAFFRYPAIPLGPMRFLPAVGYGLGPWGPEYRWEALFGGTARAWLLGYRVGDDTFRRSWGLDAVSSGLVRAGGCVFDLDAHVWEQPRLNLSLSETRQLEPRRAGWAAALSALSPMLPGGWPVRVSGGGGWKTSGFVRGKDLGAGAYWRIGLAWTPGRSQAQPDSL
jgi:hypothetical protein